MNEWFNFDLKGEVNIDNVLSILTASNLGLLLVIILGTFYLLRKWEIKSDLIKGLIALGFFVIIAYSVFMLFDNQGKGGGDEKKVPQNISGLVTIDGTINPVESVKLKISLGGKDFFAVSESNGYYEFTEMLGQKSQLVRIYVESEKFKIPNGGKNIETNLGKTGVPIYLIEIGK